MNNQSINYDTSTQLLKVSAIATIGKTDLISAIKILPIFFNNDRKLYVLLDFSNTEVRITIKDLSDISDYLLEIVLPENCIRIAKIVCKPKETALALLFKNIVQDRSQLKCEVFSTKSAAMKWLINYKL